MFSAAKAFAERVYDHWDNIASPADEEVDVGADNHDEEQDLHFYGCVALTDAVSLVKEA
jgi:hypothetical protein